MNYITSHPLISIGVVASAGLVTSYFLVKRKKCEFKVSQLPDQENNLLKYALDHSLQLHPAQKKLQEITLQHYLGKMMAVPEVAQLLQILLKLLNAKSVIEVGVFTGYSTLAFALVLPDDGKIVACDISEEFMNIGIPFWKEAGVEHKIIKKIKPALETLDELLANGEAGTYDFAFIDAEKENYVNYYELCLQLVRTGGLIAIDNVFWGGSVMEGMKLRVGTKEIKELNDKIKCDKRVVVSMVNIADGLTLAIKL